ncbi:hypothetical protein C5167_042725 [Papaver somniferum]|uniref:Peptidase M10 metallopeptidase domain-containing protein n=1 Tax=Papaver somniferum TaxID=3469 RepID=A0A4Y7L3M0_PAPSO|nr:hypothetical protein C5167_042725 [Papaver somniferum]
MRMWTPGHSLVLPINSALPSHFDGPGGLLAHSFSPTDGRLHFNAEESWSTNPWKDLMDIETVAVQDIGHLLGLETAQNQKPSCILPSYLDPEKGNYMVMMFKMRMARYGIPDIVNGMTSMRSDKKKHTNGAANCTVSRSTASFKDAQDGQLPNPTLPTTNLAVSSQLLISKL